MGFNATCLTRNTSIAAYLPVGRLLSGHFKREQNRRGGVGRPYNLGFRKLLQDRARLRESPPWVGRRLLHPSRWEKDLVDQ